jgi:hypothetical protein
MLELTAFVLRPVELIAKSGHKGSGNSNSGIDRNRSRLLPLSLVQPFLS